MADYGFNTQLTPQTQQSSLGDMLNLARGIQSYQQAQQINPLAVQQQQAATQKGLLELKQLETANRERDAVLPYLQDPSNYSNEDGMIDMNKATAAIYKLAPQTGNIYAKNLQELASGQLQIAQSKQNLTQSGKSILANALGPLAYGGEKDPKAYMDALQRAVKVDPALAPIAKNYMNMLSKFQPGDHIATDFVREIQGLQSASEQYSQFAPKAGLTSLGGIAQPTVTKPSVGGAEPTIKATGEAMEVKPTPGFQTINGVTYFADKNGSLHPLNSPAAISAGQPPAPKPAAPTTQPAGKPLVQEDMPVPQGGLRQMNEQQKSRYEAGQKLFSTASDVNQKAADQKNILDSIKQNISQAQSSRPGQLLRQGSKFVRGSEELDTLLKDLAANQMLQAQTMGADTDAARQTSAVANGSADIDPKALAKIVERADATRLAAQMYNQGLSAYKQRDPLNSAIHADRFQQAWKDNYDPRIFLVDNINQSNRTPQEKQAEIRKIVGIATPQELAQLKQKAINIRRLQTGDF